MNDLSAVQFSEVFSSAYAEQELKHLILIRGTSWHTWSQSALLQLHGFAEELWAQINPRATVTRDAVLYGDG